MLIGGFDYLLKYPVEVVVVQFSRLIDSSRVYRVCSGCMASWPTAPTTTTTTTTTVRPAGNAFIAARLRERYTHATYGMLCGPYAVLFALGVAHYNDGFDARKHRYDAAVWLMALPGLMLAVNLCQVVAMRWARDEQKLVMTRVTQVVVVIATNLRCLVALSGVLACPQTSNTESIALDCNATESVNPLHIQSRISTVMYAAMTIQPIHLMLHMVPVLPVILPSTMVLFVVHQIVAFSVMPDGSHGGGGSTGYAIDAGLYPFIAALLIIGQGYRFESHLRTIYEQKQQIVDDHAAHEMEKKQWYAGVGHNIGTPLTSIMLANEAIAALHTKLKCEPSGDGGGGGGGGGGEKVHALVTHIRVATDYIRVVYTTLMAGLRTRETARLQRFSAREFMARCEAVTSAYGVRTPGVQVTYTTATDVPECLVCDYGKLQQCVVNLVSNAQKITKEGSVSVIMQVVDYDVQRDDADEVGEMDAGVGMKAERSSPGIERNPCLRISVIDTGPGIPKELLPHFFNQSMGLGLPTVLRFVESMSGTFRVTNNASGLGATFCVEIPVEKSVENPLRDGVGLDIVQDDHMALVDTLSIETDWAATSATTAAPATTTATAAVEMVVVDPEAKSADRKKRRILVVDDQEFNRALIAEMVRTRCHADVEEAGDGVAALALMSEKPPFDVILMDLEMPRMSGQECFERIISALGDQRPRVIALSASTAIVYRHGAPHFDAFWDKSNMHSNIEKLEAVLSRVQDEEGEKKE